jgi:hypothetical protein
MGVASVLMKLLRYSGLYLSLSPILAGVVLLQAFPWHPHSELGWVLLFVIPLPVVSLMGTFRQPVPGNPASGVAEAESQSSEPRWMRRGYFLILGILVFIFEVTFFH